MVEEGEKEGKKGADILTHFPQMTRAEPKQELTELDPQNTNKKLLMHYNEGNRNCEASSQADFIKIISSKTVCSTNKT